MRHDLGADDARRAGAVVDDDLLPEHFAEALGDTTRAITSTGPPADDGAIMRIGRLG